MSDSENDGLESDYDEYSVDVDFSSEDEGEREVQDYGTDWKDKDRVGSGWIGEGGTYLDVAGGDLSKTSSESKKRRSPRDALLEISKSLGLRFRSDFGLDIHVDDLDDVVKKIPRPEYTNPVALILGLYCVSHESEYGVSRSRFDEISNLLPKRTPEGVKEGIIPDGNVFPEDLLRYTRMIHGL